MKILAKLAKQMSASFVRKSSTRRVKNSQNQTPPDGSTPASTKNTSTENMTNLSSRSFNSSISPRTEASTLKNNNDKDNTSQSSTSSDFHDEDSATHFSEQFEQEDEIIEEVPCPCSEHFGRLIMDKEFKVSVEKFYELLFTDNEFLTMLNQKTKTAEYVAATWVRDHQGDNTRTCTYTVSLAHAMAPKAIIVNEKQILTHYPNPKQGIMMQKETQNSGVPYSDNFTVNCRYCISRTGPTSCRIKVHGGVMYKKSTWAVVKTFIEKGTHQGLDEHYQLLSKLVDEYAANHPDEDLRAPMSITFPNGRDVIKSCESESTPNEVRHRRSQKSPERLLAGGEIAKIVDDSQFLPESQIIQPIATTNKLTAVDYKPFLIAIIALLTLFFIANIWILHGFHRESLPVSRNDQDLAEMLSTLMDQVKQLKEKVDQIKKSE